MRDADDFLVARLRFKHLALIEALGRLQSIRKAARAIHVSEPAVSKALAEIEASFGFTLFVRSPAGVVPTPQGHAVIQGARQLLNSLRHVRSSAEKADRGLAVRLGANPFVAQTFLPKLATELLGSVANLHIDLREGPGPQLLTAIRDGEIDAALIVISQQDLGNRHESELTIRPLYTELLTVIAPKEHPLSRKASVGWSALAGERWILPPPPALVAATIRNAFLVQGVVPPEPWILSPAPRTSVALVAAGMGLSAVPSPFSLAAKGTSAVTTIRVTPQVHLPPVSFVYRTAARLDEAIVTLNACLDTIESDRRGQRG